VDSITHIALGAVTGEAIAGRAIGKRAMFIGALAQSFPDIDFIAAAFLPSADNLLLHRGFTHSFLFGVLSTMILSFLARRTHREHDFPLSLWFLFIGVEIFLHLFTDACNAYGIGWFEPFSHQRISFHILFVADPFFSIWTGLALFILMGISSKAVTLRRSIIVLSLGLTAAYFFYALYNKVTIESRLQKYLATNAIPYKSLLTTPTPLNSWLWFAAIEDETGFHTTYHSVNEDENKINFSYFPQNKELISGMRDDHELQQLLRFSQGKYTIEQRGDTLIFNDLRFGQIAGWANPEAPFTFHYYLNYPDANLMVIQRGRFSNWNQKTFNSMVERIMGR
jgi:inner membrane protein